MQLENARNAAWAEPTAVVVGVIEEAHAAITAPQLTAGSSTTPPGADMNSSRSSTEGEHGQARADVMVDTATLIVLGAVGLDTSGETARYVAGWGRDRGHGVHFSRSDAV
jgi:hypothetical protein